MSDSYRSFLEEQFEPVGGVSIRSMFGGLGVFRDGVMFALVSTNDALYFRVDDGNRAAFEAEDSEPFVYSGKGKPMTMSYWRAPERLFDDDDEFRRWSEAAIAAAHRVAALKPPKKRKPRGAS